MRFLASLLLGTGLMFGPAAVGATDNLIRNGSFEEGPFTGAFAEKPWITFGVDSYDGGGKYGDMMKYWTISVGSVDLVNTFWAASDGTSSVDLIGDNFSSEMSQSFAPVAGRHYRVSFDLAANPVAPPTAAFYKILAVNVFDDSNGAGWLRDLVSLDVGDRTRENMGWQNFSFEFLATSSTARLSLEANSESCCWGPAIDNISISEYIPASPVSEPAIFALFLAGLGLVSRVVHKRRLSA